MHNSNCSDGVNLSAIATVLVPEQVKSGSLIPGQK